MDDLYLMQDGTYVKPSEVSPDKAGVLRSKSGLAVVTDAAGAPVTAEGGSVTNMNVMAAKVGVSDAPPPEIAPPPAPKKEKEPVPPAPKP